MSRRKTLGGSSPASLLVAVMFGVALAHALPASADPPPAAVLIARSTATFSPARKQSLPLSFRLEVGGEVAIQVLSGDGDTIRTIRSKSILAPGVHVLSWDGRDDAGRVVPDEAYHPVLLHKRAGEALKVQHDPRRNSGGIVLDQLRTELSADGAIGFALAQPARVLVRVGIRGGAMMRALETWTAKPAGRVHVQWDGFDESHAVRIFGKPGLTVLVTGYSLPDHTILTSGNEGQDYFAYRTQRGLPPPLVKTDIGALERGGQRLSRQASLPRSALRDPRVSLVVTGTVRKRDDGSIQVTGPVTFRVDIPPQDRWLLQQSLYEVGFFLDQQFVSEEETGFTPISWRWVPNELAPGAHTMTVNVSGLWGQVGVASVPLFVERE